MSGFELMEQVRIRYPQIKSVVLTCHHEFDYVQEALRLGAIDYIVKTLLNRNNVDETITRILKRLTWETRESAVPAAPATARSFPGAAAFCSFGCKGQLPPLLDILPSSIRPSALGDSIWLHVMGNADAADWMKELPVEVMEHWQPVHISSSANVSMSEAKTAISQRLREYLFYWPKGEAPSVVSLEDLLAENRPGASEDEVAALCRELENMRWSLFGKDWKHLMDRIEEGGRLRTVCWHRRCKLPRIGGIISNGMRTASSAGRRRGSSVPGSRQRVGYPIWQPSSSEGWSRCRYLAKSRSACSKRWSI